jgi:SnoaL-like domain
VDDRIIELLYRNLQEVFGEGDAARRRAAIEDFYTEDCVLHVPPGVFVGHDALDKFAGDLRATHPHFVYTPHGEPQALTTGGFWHGAQARKARPQTTPDWMSSLFAMARLRRSTSFSIPNLA